MERSSIINGSLSCFCDEIYDLKGISAMFDKYHQDSSHSTGLSYKICQNYFISKTTSEYYYLFSVSTTYMFNCLFFALCDSFIRAICCVNLIFER